MRFAVVFLAAIVAGCSSAAPFAPFKADRATSYVETQLDPHGRLTTRSGGDGRPSALYQIGSISKFACTLAVIDLQREGKLSLSDSIGDLLPGYRGKAGARISLLQLLQNRSGLADGVRDAFQSNPDIAKLSLSSVEAANRYADDVVAPAGREFDYVLANWIVVQAILEEVAGAPIGEVLATHVFTPAGLTDTVAFSGSLPGADAVVPSEPIPPIPDFLACAGGVASTSDDLVRLVRYPYRGMNLPADDLAALVGVTTADEDYALGGRIKRVAIAGGEHVLSWQSGSNGAFKSRAVYDPQLDIGYAIVTNENANDLIDERRDAWLRDVVSR